MLIMVDYEACSKRMVEILGLKNEPVAIKLIKKGSPCRRVPEPEKNLRHCQSIMKARKGSAFSCHITSTPARWAHQP